MRRLWPARAADLYHCPECSRWYVSLRALSLHEQATHRATGNSYPWKWLVNGRADMPLNAIGSTWSRDNDGTGTRIARIAHIATGEVLA